MTRNTRQPPMPPTPPSQQSTQAAATPPTVRFDWREWLPYLEDDVPEDQKQALVETLWAIVQAFVDIGFDVNSDPQSCGQMIDLKAALEATMVNCDETPTDIANQREDA